jgi:gamma-glutamyltranspeptidase / glutathione hydrolase
VKILQLMIGLIARTIVHRGVLPAISVGLFLPSIAPVAQAQTAMVTSDSRLASQAGAKVLAHGGNAADAACATALALGVVNPFASGLGGGGFALIYSAKTEKVEALDFRETAPAGLRPDKIDRIQSVRGGLAAGVPGEPAGLSELVRRWGRRSFANCVEPAEHLAHGFPASAWLVEHVADEFKKNPREATRFLPQVLARPAGTIAALRTGDRVRRPDLARTLSLLRRKGTASFYRGEIARAIVNAVQSAGGVLNSDDLANYAPIERTPLSTTFLNRRIFAMPPPSAGGVVLLEVLGILGQRMKTWDPAGPQDPAYVHLLVEALKHGFADRSRYLGDPGFVSIPLSRLLDPANLQDLAARIRLDGTLAQDRYGTGEPTAAPPARDAGTAHISVIDAEGNAVALTTTINLEFGAHLVAAGILLNNQMDDFSLFPGKPDAFGLVAGGQNALAPGKRPLSSMSPTIVLNPKGVELVLGAAGGPTIISTTVQVLLDALLFGLDAQAAENAPRLHHQWSPDLLYYEPDFPPAAVESLRAKGHKMLARAKIGKVNLVIRRPTGLQAAPEPRSGGAPAGY